MNIRPEQIRLSQLIFLKAMKLQWGKEGGSERHKRKSGKGHSGQGNDLGEVRLKPGFSLTLAN